jgi:putative FmdB family regulatory protein
MPVYEFVCRDCHSRFDTLVRSFDAAKDVTCRECSGPNVRRLVSGFAMVGGYDDPIVSSGDAGSGGCCGGSCGCHHQ